MTTDVLKAGGPRKCPHPCSVCPDANHHWLAHCFNPDDPLDPDDLKAEPYVKYGLESWYECKHCDAWIEDVNLDDIDGFE